MMRIFQNTMLSVLLLLASPLSLLAEESTEQIDLVSAMSRALQKNPRISLLEAAIERQYHVKREALSLMLPEVLLSGRYEAIDRDLLPSFEGDTFGSDKEWDTSLAIQVPLYKGGAGGAFYEQQSLQLQAATFALVEGIREVIFSVKQRFYELLLRKAQLKVQQQLVHLLEEELRSERNKLRAGAVSEFNVLRAEVALANSRTPLVRARNNVVLAREELRRVMGESTELGTERRTTLHVNAELGYKPFAITAEAALAEAAEHRAELRRLRLLIAAAKEGVAVAWADYLPGISLRAAYDLQKSPFSNDAGDSLDGWRVEVNADWKLFDSFRTRSKVAQARADMRTAELQLRQHTLDIELEVRRAYSTLIESKELVQTSDKVIGQAEESLRLAENRFDAGVTTQLELLDAQVALTEARSNHVQALYDYNVAIARLEQAIGR